MFILQFICLLAVLALLILVIKDTMRANRNLLIALCGITLLFIILDFIF